MSDEPTPIRGRGAASNPPNRFERLHYEPDPEAPPPEPNRPETQLFRDRSRSIITTNDSPDVGFETSINPYRGCSHGCTYCYARPTHEFLGLSAGLDFETKILVKENAPELLRRELTSPRWKPRTVSLSGVTDPYQPIERKLRLTRRCLEVLVEFHNPVGIVTKNHLVTRDLDLLGELGRHNAAAVFLSITTLDGRLARELEPRTSHPNGRLAAVEELTRAGIPVGVMVAPVIPGLTDHELPAIIAAFARAGARHAGYVPLRLPLAVGPLFEEWLTLHVPEKKEKILSRIRDMRGGKLNDSHFGSRMRGQGGWAEMMRDVFHLACRKNGMNQESLHLSTAAFRRPGEQQLLFEDI